MLRFWRRRALVLDPDAALVSKQWVREELGLDDEAEPEPEPTESLEPGDRWGGPVCFGADGWFYPVLIGEYDAELGPDRSRRLIHVVPEEGEAWFQFAEPDHRDHQSFWALKHPQGTERVLEVE